MNGERRKQLQPAWLLHHRPWSDSSRILDLVTRNFGRVTLFAHVDAAVFADAGNVAARVSELNLDKRSYGIGWRMHSRTSTFARVDLARGAEGWRVLFRLNDPLHLSRMTRRLAPVPFVP